MKSIIPFTKELDFSTKLSEITSISLEREFEVKETTIEGNLFVTGEYKSHEVSANVLPFSFKIPFSIEIPEIKKDTITLEISDFAYDIMEENKIKVNIELELCGDLEEREPLEEKEQEEERSEPFSSEELLEFVENHDTEEKEEESHIEIIEEEPEKEVVIEEQEKEEVQSDEVLLHGMTDENEFATYHIHIVKDGENIETICTMYNSNVNILQEYNDIGNLTPGDKLIIPENDES